ncbi:uncharacterized protein CC84DRAFT_1183616 [Paraphaeosphaeria sporulosa]|uniref:Uncharacterized protein n=1 Tax=Paraphaeosphaeria sporulosa TaxID=1460663 RepID=A0A177D1S0_9PLEO|nr:uncharacterized protein CC84DRAFT_1183616 [Paraphaeosphaeria sporulosa]OAG13187.1 hypothetical protein CC84DRAFT_1183616 [Paraphaeosphaeria sporulosa]
MRLLKSVPDGGFGLTSFDDDSIPPYAILSYTCIEGQEDGYTKIRFCGDRAAADGLEYFWYKCATKCYVYLSNISIPDEEKSFQRSRWFTRGWTLQELLAPPSLEFFSQNSRCLGTRVSLELEIQDVTGIPVKALRDPKLSNFSVDERLKWVAKRTTTVKEDKVFCLLRIFGVFLPLIYGEGVEYATSRLKDEIQKRQQGQGKTDLQDIPKSQLQAIEQILFISDTHRRITIYGLGSCGKLVLALEFTYRALTRHLVKEALRQLDDWLIIVDNADDPRLLFDSNSNAQSARLVDYIPYSNTGSVLFTTRSRKVATELTQTHILKLDSLGQSKAQQLLARQILRQALLNDRAVVDELLKSLTPELFSERFKDASRYLGMDSTQIQRQDPLIAEYLSFILCVDRINIPQSLLPPATSQLQHINALSTITGYAFLTERQETILGANKERFFDMYRLGYSQRKAWVAYLPHALHVVGIEDALDVATSARLLERIGLCRESNGQYAPAELALQKAWSLRKGLLGREHPDTLTSVSNLGSVLSSQGKYEEAEAMQRRALEGYEKVLGREHPDMLTSVSNLGSVLSGQGKYEEAEAMQRWALEGSEKVLGREHPDMLTSVSNLGSVLSGQGKYEEAEAMQRRALEGREKVLGRKHPDTLTSASQLGSHVTEAPNSDDYEWLVGDLEWKF